MTLDRSCLRIAAAVGLCCVSGLAQSTVQISLNTAGSEGNLPSRDAVMSADGRFVAFDSDAWNLVAMDTNGVSDVFVRDTLLNVTTRVSVDSGGAQGNGASYYPAISADGRYVAFSSAASNLVPGDTNGQIDVFVHDMLTGTTTRVSVSSTGAEANGVNGNCSMSSDGRYIAWYSAASNLVPGDANGVADIFVHDMMTGTTTLESVSSAGVQGNDISAYPSISGDGRYVAYYSYATNLVPGDTNGATDIFVRDRLNNLTQRVSVDSSGNQANSYCYGAVISANGRYVAFWTEASNLVPADTNLHDDVFVHDLVNGTTTRVSVSSTGLQGDNESTGASISADGRFVAFGSDSTNLVPGDSNGAYDMFVHDMLTGSTTRVSLGSSNAQGNGDSDNFVDACVSAISADGRFIAFSSTATNLVAGDVNSAMDVFERDRGNASALVQLCFGDGISGPCPCGNRGGAGRGCQNSAATGGGVVTGSGAASLASDSVQFTSSGELPTALSIVLQGSSLSAPANFGDGLRCAGGSLKRLYVKHAVGGIVTAPQAGDPSVSARSAALGDVIPVGATSMYELYYRD